MSEWGATVRCSVSDNWRGHVVHLLESDPDVFIVGRESEASHAREWLMLRSDRFPSWWEGAEVCAYFPSYSGHAEFVPVMSSEWPNDIASIFRRIGESIESHEVR